MSSCTFFGHSECYGLDAEVLRKTIEDLIAQGVDAFYVGNQGQFDAMVYHCLKQLRKVYPHIWVSVVLAYLLSGKQEYGDMSDTMYPEIEGHPQFAIGRRNRFLIDTADICLCYVNHTWGGAYKYAKRAKRKGLVIINLGSVEL